MSKTDKALVEAALKTITTGPEAMTMPDNPGWACIQLDQHKRVYVLAYHGMEVALFFKRQLTESKLYPGDRFPEGVMQDPVDAWQRLDLLGQSATRANLVLTRTMNQLKEENRLLSERVRTLEMLADRLENQVKSATTALLMYKEGVKRKLAPKRRRNHAA